MKYNKPTGLGKLKYLVPAGFLALTGCNELVKQPAEDAAVLRADYECLIKEIGSYSDILNEWLRTEKQGYGVTEALAIADKIMRDKNPDLGNPYLYKGKLNFQDINGDGKFSEKMMKCGQIVKPKYNQQKTVPRSGKR